MSESRAIVGVVDEWSDEEPGTRPKTKRKIVGGLLGAVKSTREFEEDGAKLVEVGVDYAGSSRVPKKAMKALAAARCGSFIPSSTAIKWWASKRSSTA
jgi:hypothetical protein